MKHFNKGHENKSIANQSEVVVAINESSYTLLDKFASFLISLHSSYFKNIFWEKACTGVGVWYGQSILSSTVVGRVVKNCRFGEYILYGWPRCCLKRKINATIQLLAFFYRAPLHFIGVLVCSYFVFLWNL